MGLIAFVCAALIVSASQCGQLVILPPPGEFQITQWDFEYTHGNASEKICGVVPNTIAGTPLGMWAELSVQGEPVTLKITAKVNFTDSNGNTYPITMSKSNQTYYAGNFSVHLVSEYNYQVGKYDVLEVTARLPE